MDHSESRHLVGDDDIAECMRLVEARNHKSRLTQLAEIVRLVLGPGRISPRDYYAYQLYDDQLHDADAKRRFLGDNSVGSTILRVCDPGWSAVASDKLLSSAVLSAYGLRVPGIRAVYHPFRAYPHAECLVSPAELASFLRRPGTAPFFAKPVSGLQGRGAFAVRTYDGASDELVHHDGSRTSIDHFVHLLGGPRDRSGDSLDLERGLEPRSGYLFQELVRPHPTLVERCGQQVGCLRAYVIVEESGPRLLEVVWKIAAPHNVNDNYWRSGNLLAAVDRASGEVRRVIAGSGPWLRELEVNPYTGQPLVGLGVPFFAESLAVAMQGAAIFPNIRFQGWDVAIGKDGPIVIEVNGGSAFSLSQLASGRGFLSEEFAAFLTRAESANRARRTESMHRDLTRPLQRLEGAFRVARSLARAWRRPPDSRDGPRAETPR